jgi:hypothetical protein
VSGGAVVGGIDITSVVVGAGGAAVVGGSVTGAAVVGGVVVGAAVVGAAVVVDGAVVETRASVVGSSSVGFGALLVTAGGSEQLVMATIPAIATRRTGTNNAARLRRTGAPRRCRSYSADRLECRPDPDAACRISDGLQLRLHRPQRENN